MKKIVSVIGLLAVMATSAYAATVSEVVADHLTSAASYEAKAAEQDALIAEHQKMKGEFRDRYFINEKVTPMAPILEMDNHCNAIIRDASKLRGDYVDFARWHRMLAKELSAKEA